MDHRWHGKGKGDTNGSNEIRRHATSFLPLLGSWPYVCESVPELPLKQLMSMEMHRKSHMFNLWFSNFSLSPSL
jgi:hypothetical protein